MVGTAGATTIALSNQSPSTYDITNMPNQTRAFSITANQTVNITWFLNETPVQYNMSVTSATYTNASLSNGHWNITAYLNNSAGNVANQMWNWTVEWLPVFEDFMPDDTTINDYLKYQRNFNISLNQTGLITWYLNGTSVQTATSNADTYWNISAQVGYWNLSVYVSNANGSTIRTWYWNVTESWISSVGIVTNLSGTDKIRTSSNSTFNLTIADPANLTWINVTFPDTFAIGGFGFTSDVLSSNYDSFTVTKSGSTIRLNNNSGNSAAIKYINFSTNITSPAAQGDYSIKVTTSANTTGKNFTVYNRIAARPFYVTANNSVFTYSNETTSANTVLLQLTGTGVANLTFYAANITGETNITVGYGATNVTQMRVVWCGTLAVNCIYVITNGSVANPIVNVSKSTPLTASNLPYGVIAGGGVIAAVLILYASRRRTR